MRDDDDGEIFLQFGDQLLDAHGGDGIESRAGFVHEQHFRTVGDGAGDAKALHLSAGQPERALVQAVFHFLPQRGAAQAALHRLVEHGSLAHAGDAQAVDDVFVDGFGEGIRFLEDHADKSAQGDDFDRRIPDAAAGKLDVAGVTDAVDQLVHAVEIAQQSRFAAAGRSDERGDLALGNVEGDVLQRLLFAVEEIEAVHRDDVGASGKLRRFEDFLGGGSGGRGLRLFRHKKRCGDHACRLLKTSWAVTLVAVTRRTSTSDAVQAIFT